MKTIVTRWVKCNVGMYKFEQRVIASDHENYPVGCRFDFGFMSIVGEEEGYTVVVLPPTQES